MEGGSWSISRSGERSMALKASTVGTEVAPWLPLLQRLTELSPLWGVWKNADDALLGQGDVDSVAPRNAWPRIIDEYRRWAADFGVGPVVVCPHVPGSLLLVACQPGSPSLFELHVLARSSLRGAPLFSAEDLKPLMCLDPRGFRRLRPGAEGLLLLFYNGTRSGGRAAPEVLRARRIDTLLRRDPEGTVLASTLFGTADRHAIKAAQAAEDQDWNRWSVLLVETLITARVLRHPLAVLRAQLRARRGLCPVIQALKSGRRAPTDQQAWLQRVAKTHEVH